MTDVRLRPATLADSLAVWRWRNEPAVRAVSRRQQRIRVEAYAREFRRGLEGDERWSIIEIGGEPAGFVRMTPEGDDVWDIGIALAPEARGRGVGPTAIREASLEVAREGGTVVAQIRDWNDHSLAAFRHAGFVPHREEPGWVFLRFDGS